MSTEKKKINKSEILITLKVTKAQKARMNRLAKRHAGANLSAWLRHCGLKYVPGSGEVIR